MAGVFSACDGEEALPTVHFDEIDEVEQLPQTQPPSEAVGDDEEQEVDPEFRSCTVDEDCDPHEVCFEDVCVGQGRLRVSLAFTADSDFDLHLRTPSGAEIYYRQPLREGGELDVDMCVQACESGVVHVENIYFGDTVPCGTHTAWVENFDGRAAGDFELEIEGDADEWFAGELTDSPGQRSEEFLIDVACDG